MPVAIPRQSPDAVQGSDCADLLPSMHPIGVKAHQGEEDRPVASPLRWPRDGHDWPERLRLPTLQTSPGSAKQVSADQQSLSLGLCHTKSSNCPNVPDSPGLFYIVQDDILGEPLRELFPIHLV